MLETLRERAPLLHAPGVAGQGANDVPPRAARLRTGAHSAALALQTPASLRLGNGEELTGGRKKPSIVSDALEAVIGAIFLDGGIEVAREFIMNRVIRLLEEARVDEMDKDYKTRLQEYVQKGHIGTLEYECQGEAGPEHQKMFTTASASANPSARARD